MKSDKITPNQIVQTLQELPPEALPEVAEFLEFLKFKLMRTKRQSPYHPVALGGLWKDLPCITEEDIVQARREMWGKFQGNKDE